MAEASRQMHICLNTNGLGFFGSAWRHPVSDPQAAASVEHFVNCARIAERGMLDAVFLPDKPALGNIHVQRPMIHFEPIILLAAMAQATRSIGLIGTMTTTYNDPYNVARRVSTLDHITGGRAGWNIVTTDETDASGNFGYDKVPAHDARYSRADEFVSVCKALWDSWEPDAVIGDKASGSFVDASRIHEINHIGVHFSVRGPLNLPRSPQGWPFLVQAGGSSAGRELAAHHADAVFCLTPQLQDAKAIISDIRLRAERVGRDPSRVKALPGILTVIAPTEAEAIARKRELEDLLPLEAGINRLSGLLQIDPALLELDKPLPEDFRRPVNVNQSVFDALMQAARDERMTVRELIRRTGGGIGHRMIVGTPQQVADEMAAWFRAGAAEGFNIMPDILPSGAETFVDHVVPELQRRGLFRTAYRENETLRERFGVALTSTPAAH